MKILGLYNNDCAIELFQWLKEKGYEVILVKEKLNIDWCREQHFDLTISYTYRFILSAELLEALGNNVVNIHNSYLPWNRGADPNLWSIVEDTPRGVSLHYMNAELDKGEIIVQELLKPAEDNQTLHDTYYELDAAAKDMMKRALSYYDYWPEMKKKVVGLGTYQSLKDVVKIKSMITSYDMKVGELKDIKVTKNNRGGARASNNHSEVLAA